MPAKSEAQRRLMQAAAHNLGIAKKTGISQKVAREYVDKDDKAKRPVKKK